MFGTLLEVQRAMEVKYMREKELPKNPNSSKHRCSANHYAILAVEVTSVFLV